MEDGEAFCFAADGAAGSEEAKEMDKPSVRSATRTPDSVPNRNILARTKAVTAFLRCESIGRI